MCAPSSDSRTGLTCAATLLGVALLLSSCAADPCLSRVGTLDNPEGTALNLGQCWSPKDLRRFYGTSFGSQLAPYDLVVPLMLAEPDSANRGHYRFTAKSFFDGTHIEERWRFLAMEESDWDERSHVNRDDIKAGWPVGFVIDERTKGKWDWRGEWVGLTCAACHTAQINYTDPKDKTKTWKLRVAGGPAMADVNGFMEDLRNSLAAVYEDGVKGGGDFEAYAERHKRQFGPEDRTKLLSRLRTAVYERDLWHIRNAPPDPAGYARLDAFGVIFNDVMRMTDRKPVNASDVAPPVSFASDVDAPVSFPFLWHFSSHNQTQWNGSGPAVSLLVNVAATLGLFGKYDPTVGWFEDPSTARLDNLRELQSLLDRLRSPKWPEQILGGPDEIKAARGGALFESKCRSCHAAQPREEKLGRVYVTMVPAKIIETDPKMVTKANQRQLKDPSGKHVTKASGAVGGATFDIIFSLSHPGESLSFVGEALSALLLPKKSILFMGPNEAYKARPLEGIWATAPYLHNGSVPNLYELLLPQEKRTKHFCVGSREFDPKHVGFVMMTEAECRAKNHFWLDTTREGNHNTGHDGPRFGVDTEEQIWELVEYLKTL